MYRAGEKFLLFAVWLHSTLIDFFPCCVLCHDLFAIDINAICYRSSPIVVLTNEFPNCFSFGLIFMFMSFGVVKLNGNGWWGESRRASFDVHECQIRVELGTWRWRQHGNNLLPFRLPQKPRRWKYMKIAYVTSSAVNVFLSPLHDYDFIWAADADKHSEAT